MAVHCRERKRIAKPEAVELEREGIAPRVVDLVRHEQHGLVRDAQDLGQLLVAGRDPDLRVDHENNEVCIGDRALCLVGNLPGEIVLAGDVDAAGIDQQEALARPLADELLAVARRPARVVHDGGARTRQPVDERRLADVREADDRDRAEEFLPGPATVLVTHAGCRSRTSCSIRPTTSSTSSSVVSI